MKGWIVVGLILAVLFGLSIVLFAWNARLVTQSCQRAYGNGWYDAGMDNCRNNRIHQVKSLL